MSQPAIAVFCGASTGNSPAFVAAAQSVGRALAKDEQLLVYGGGQLGIMGAVAEATLEAGGWIHGVIPEAVRWLWLPLTRSGAHLSSLGTRGTDAHRILSQFLHKSPAPAVPLHASGGGHTSGFTNPRAKQTTVVSMHARKKVMADLVSAFLALPGGYGTLEECMEMVTWTQLGIHKKRELLPAHSC